MGEKNLKNCRNNITINNTGKEICNENNSSIYNMTLLKYNFLRNQLTF